MKQLIPGIFWLLGQGFDSNVYVIESKNDTLMIDSGIGNAINHGFQKNSKSVDLLKQIIKQKNIRNFCLTHGHIDHIGGLLSINSDLNWNISTSVFEEKQISSGNSTYIDPILNSNCSSLSITSLLNEGETIIVGDFSFEIFETPGHTKGSIVLYDKKKKILISGDTLFPQGSFGRTDLPSGSSKELLTSLKRLAELEIQILLPGHMPPVISASPINSAKTSFRNAQSMLLNY